MTAYNVSVYQGGNLVAGRSCSTAGSTNCSIAGLTKGTLYTFSVTATNSHGTGVAGEGSYTTKS